MAAAIAIAPLAPRPIVAWSVPQHHMEGKENRPALKQLQQTTPPNRTRKDRPCDGCRKRKSKCVLQETRRCVLCEFHKQDCTFVENAQPRKRKAEEGDDGSASSSPTKKSPPAAMYRQVQTVATPARPAAVTASQPPLTQTPTRKPFAMEESLSLQPHRHCKYLGQTTALDASLIGLGSFNERNETESQVGTLRQVHGSEYFSIHSDSDIPVPDDEARALAEIDQVVGSYGPALIDVYFRNVHPSYPIIQKQAFLDRHKYGDRQFNPPLMAAMYLLALAWWDYDPAFSTQPKPDVARLEYIAMSSLAIAMQRPKISAVQAGLLLLQRPKPNTWTLAVQLVALGQDIGLHLDCTAWKIPAWERRLRKRLAWALYMQDKWSAVTHGRPSHIHAADWDVPAPLEAGFDEELDDDEEGEAEQLARGRTTFIQMVELTHIMAEVCTTFYSAAARAEAARAGRYATHLVLNRAKPVQLKLKDWFARLPAECKLDASSSTTGNCSQGYLHLAYFATEISIHRHIVHSLSPSPSKPSATDAYLLYITRTAAKTRLISALDFINRLSPAHLSAWWHSSAAAQLALIGSFGALLQATSPGEEEAEFYACRLREFRWTIQMSAKWAGWVGGALELPGRAMIEAPDFGERMMVDSAGEA